MHTVQIKSNRNNNYNTDRQKRSKLNSNLDTRL